MGLQYVPMLLVHFMSLQNFAKTFKFGNESVENRNKSIKYSNIRKKNPCELCFYYFAEEKIDC